MSDKHFKLITNKEQLIKTLFSILSFALLSTSTNADINYDYFEIGYENTKLSNLESANTDFELKFNDINVHGLGFEGSYSLGESYFVYADFDFTNFNLSSDIVDFLDDAGSVNVDPDIVLNTQVLGLGFHTDGDTQFVTKAGILRQKIDSNFLKEGTFGYDIELGGRGLFSNNFEWEANINYFDPDLNKGDSGDIGVNTSLRYHFSNNFSTDFSISKKDDELALGLNLRFNLSQ